MDPDPLEELNRMADAITSSQTTDLEPTDTDITRWVTLFSYPPQTAYHLLIAHRSSLSTPHLSASHWSLIREPLEAAGYDREAYEHSLTLKDLMKSQSTVVYDTQGKRWTVVRLGGWLESAEKVREVAGLEKVPRVTEGTGGMGGGLVKFVWLDEGAWEKVERWVEVKRLVVGGEKKEGEKEVLGS